MKNRHRLPVRIAPAVTVLFASCIYLAAGCGEPIESAALASGTNSVAWCTSDSGCGDAAPAAAGDAAAPAAAGDAAAAIEKDWLVRCTSDTECAIGQCVCGLCTEPCDGESNACSNVPEAASCFTGRDIAHAALCRATTVPGICLPGCTAGEDCGEGHICALGACLPRPPAP
jgi:hypothetical protein